MTRGTRRTPEIIVLLLAAALVGHAQQQPATPDDQGWTTTVRGTVIRSDTREPVAGVSVNLSGTSVTTDPSGRFSFERIRPGRHTVYSYPDGFLMGGVPGQSVSLVIAAPDTPNEIQLILTPFASVSGTVHDPQGHPLPLATVELRHLSHQQGRFVMTWAAQDRTDDRGHYRPSGPGPGEYFVRVTPPRRDSQTSGAGGWIRT